MKRFWDKVEKTSECWNWTGAKIPGGYGSIWDSETKKSVMAHRKVYELCVGPIPEGFNWTIDHLCKNRLCVNPEHLELVSRGENANRGDGPTGINSRKTHCINGHLLEGDNLYIEPTNGKRRCRMCRNQSNRDKRREKYHIDHPDARYTNSGPKRVQHV